MNYDYIGVGLISEAQDNETRMVVNHSTILNEYLKNRKTEKQKNRKTEKREQIVSVNIKSNYEIIILSILSANFHFLWLFTSTGNYFHGGTPSGWIFLQFVAVSCVYLGFISLKKSSYLLKALIAILCALPLTSLSLTLVSLISDKFF